MKAQTICIRLLILFTLLAVGCEAPVTAKKAGGLVWSDEFDGTAVDSSKWTFETGNNGGWGNSELEYYRSENAAVADLPGEAGRGLVITAKKETYNGFGYTSSRLKTQGKASWTYGRIEARLKLPEGQGIWPAFWMLGESIAQVGWPKCSEIDIMEMVGGGGRDSTTHGTGHWDDNGHVYQGGSVALGTKLSAAFHVYAVEWTKSSLTWSVDGKAFYTLPITAVARSEFHAPSFLLLNLAVGGQWPGNPDGTTVFPQEFWIDWIRVYQ